MWYWEVFLALSYGATLVITPPNGHKDPACLQKLITKYKVTIAFFVPSMLAMLLDHIEQLNQKNCFTMDSLRYMLTIGEALSPTLCQRFISQSNSRLINSYGVTEADVTVWEYPRDNAGAMLRKIPIGKPTSNTKVYILDEQLKPVPVGVPGEMCFGGLISRGYMNRPELTEKRFVQNPYHPGRIYRTGDLVQWLPDGNIDYLGRIDFQVKLRGIRIEIEEIESTLLNKCYGVKGAVVLKRGGDKPENQYLAAYVLPGNLDVELLRKELTGYLPSYMIPSRIMPMDQYPRMSSSQKIDRSKLPEIPLGQHKNVDGSPPLTGTEKIVEKIWKEVLRYDTAETIDIDSDFEHLGGSSLLVGYTTTKLRKTFKKLQIQGSAMYIHSTIRKISKYIDEKVLEQELESTNYDGRCNKDQRTIPKCARVWGGNSPTSLNALIWQCVYLLAVYPITVFNYLILVYLYSDCLNMDDSNDNLVDSFNDFVGWSSWPVGLRLILFMMAMDVFQIAVSYTHLRAHET